MKWSKYNYIYESSQHGTLLFNMLSGAFFDMSDPEAKADIMRLKEDPEHYDFSDDMDIYNMLVSSGVLCADDEDNKNVMMYRVLADRFNPRRRILTILPTLDCNLACTYCFEASNRCAGVMSAEVVQKVKDHIKKQYYRKDEPMELNWFGGEPLLGFHVMEDITEYIKSLDIPFAASITTNGILLTDKKIQKLASMHINSIQITLDGGKETHDTKRIFKDGSSTYDLILKNMAKLHDYIKQNEKIHVDIRINVDRENQDQFPALFFELRDKFPLFEVYPGIITQYQTCSTALPCFVDHMEESLFYIKLYKEYGIPSRYFQLPLMGLKSCMAERAYTDMIGPRGELYQCLQDAGNKDAEVGSLFEGKNKLHLISAYCSGNLTFNSKECRDCELVMLCGGDCVNKRYRNKKYGEKHAICAAYKDKWIFDQYLDLYYEIIQNHEQH